MLKELTDERDPDDILDLRLHKATCVGVQSDCSISQLSKLQIDSNRKEEIIHIGNSELVKIRSVLLELTASWSDLSSDYQIETV